MKHLTNTFRSRWSRYLTLLALLGSLGWMPLAQAQSLVLSNLWSAAAGTESYPFLKNDHSSRGLAYNPVTDHILVPSRTGTPAIHILDSTTGAVLGTLPYDAGIITGGNFAVNMIGITDDGVIYVGNLTTDTTGANGPFRLYRWADESAQPELVYSGDPSNGETEADARRFGDSLALRGTGTGTQILLGTFLPNAAVLTTTDGTNFTATSIQTDMAAQDGRWGLV
jgi:hypothetical protein